MKIQLARNIKRKLFMSVIVIAVPVILLLPSSCQNKAPLLIQEQNTISPSILDTQIDSNQSVNWDLEAQPGAKTDKTVEGINTALEYLGLPGMGELTNEKDSSNQFYGRRTSRKNQSREIDFSSAGSPESLIQRAISAGSVVMTSWAEGWMGGHGKAKVNLNVSVNGDMTGSFDFLSPIYDSEATTVFSQFGVRTMDEDRVIGNFGLGQRFFWNENFAIGYNLFMDQDFTRGHVRGGTGLEFWYDWLRLASNYYRPLSGWKGSKDFDANFVQERAAEGFDARITGYMPFYRNLAINAAIEKWYGEHVGFFGRDDYLNKNPKVYSAGFGWTPVPFITVNANHRYSDKRSETSLGLTLNYNFDMPLADQFSSQVVEEMRTIEGSRHEFVDRQNEMILEYRAKPGAYKIVCQKLPGLNRYKIVVTDYFGNPAKRIAVAING